MEVGGVGAGGCGVVWAGGFGVVQGGWLSGCVGRVYDGESGKHTSGIKLGLISIT